jgi:hypothetical protein
MARESLLHFRDYDVPVMAGLVGRIFSPCTGAQRDAPRAWMVPDRCAKLASRRPETRRHAKQQMSALLQHDVTQLLIAWHRDFF